jgi:hypothetical protein
MAAAANVADTDIDSVRVRLTHASPRAALELAEKTLSFKNA